jgi:flagellin
VEVTQSALQAELVFNGAGIGASAVVIDLQGAEGIVTLNFPASATSVDLAVAINAQSDATGVFASATAGTVTLLSQGHGSDQFVAVRALSGSADFDVVDRNGQTVERTTGRDAVGTINGAPTVGDGLNLQLNSFLLDVAVRLDDDFGIGSTTFAITGGGSLFQLGPRVNTNQQENIGVKSIQANKLGNRSVGFLSELMDGQRLSLRTERFQEASDVINEVIDQVAVLRGRLGAFERNTLQPNIAQLQITSENLAASESVIRDTDFAVETTELTRAQILVQAGNSILAIANAQQQNVLTLLGA